MRSSERRTGRSAGWRPHGADGPGAGLTEGGAGGDVGGGGEAARIDSLQEPFLMQRVQLSPEDGCCQ